MPLSSLSLQKHSESMTVLLNCPKNYFQWNHHEKRNFIKKETLEQVLSCELCKISKNTFFHWTPPVAASVLTLLSSMLFSLYLCSPSYTSLWTYTTWLYILPNKALSSDPMSNISLWTIRSLEPVLIFFF